jgi:hypothetical protein
VEQAYGLTVSTPTTWFATMAPIVGFDAKVHVQTVGVPAALPVQSFDHVPPYEKRTWVLAAPVTAE